MFDNDVPLDKFDWICMIGTTAALVGAQLLLK